MYSFKVFLLRVLLNVVFFGFNYLYLCEYLESVCDKEILDLCIFFFLILIYFIKCYFLMVLEMIVFWVVVEI